MTKNTVATIAKNVNDAAKATPAKGTSATVKAAPAKINALVELHLPKGTERFTSPKGIEWLRTPKQGAFQRWFQLAPKGTAETGIHKVEGDEKKGFVLTIERARVPYRELKSAQREIK